MVIELNWKIVSIVLIVLLVGISGLWPHKCRLAASRKCYFHANVGPSGSKEVRCRD